MARRHLDGERSGARAGVRGPEIRRARAGRSGQSWRLAKWILEQVRNALGEWQREPPAGSLYGFSKAYTVAIEQPTHHGFSVRAADRHLSKRQPGPSGRSWAMCSTASANDKTIFWINRDRSIVLAVQKQPGSNTVAGG